MYCCSDILRKRNLQSDTDTPRTVHQEEPQPSHSATCPSGGVPARECLLRGLGRVPELGACPAHVLPALGRGRLQTTHTPAPYADMFHGFVEPECVPVRASLTTRQVSGLTVGRIVRFGKGGWCTIIDNVTFFCTRQRFSLLLVSKRLSRVSLRNATLSIINGVLARSASSRIQRETSSVVHFHVPCHQ